MVLKNIGEKMSRKIKLLSKVLEELKKYKEGALLDKTVSIYNNEDDYFEKVSIKTAKLRNLNSSEFKSYRVMHYYQLIFNPTIIEIYVEKENKDE